MTVVFVHGVPDTAELWDGVIQHLHRSDAVAVRLPGFGSERPAGFHATKESYVDWLIGVLEGFDHEVDLVGHDWGALLTMRVASVAPDLVRGWVAGPAPIDERYVWHDVAQMWQTPEVGEAVMAALTSDRLEAALVADRVPPPLARSAADRVDDVMKACILDLYRSAVDMGREWAPELTHANPNGLLLWGVHDPFASIELGERVAGAAGVPIMAVDTGHWWPAEIPQDAARIIERHLESVVAT